MAFDGIFSFNILGSGIDVAATRNLARQFYENQTDFRPPIAGGYARTCFRVALRKKRFPSEIPSPAMKIGLGSVKIGSLNFYLKKIEGLRGDLASPAAAPRRTPPT